ncbi:MAG: hypothetical protein ABFS21_06595 [Actinomycetota bacterium]
MEDLSCVECHNNTTIITGKTVAWETSAHGTGGSVTYAGGRGGCAACHSGGAFTAMIAAGQNPSEYEAGDPAPTRQDCRACHVIHTSYTADDWALTTTDPVALYAFEGTTFDGGSGNLCATCHQPRRAIAEPTDGNIEVTSTHWGPHHGPQSAVLLGMGGAGDTTGSAMAHALEVPDTCVSCHVGETDDHTFGVSIDACVACHSGAEDFDIGGVQTEVQEGLDAMKEALLAKGWLAEEEDHGEVSIHPVVGLIPEAEAEALWNWILLSVEDGSLGIHNPEYTLALIEEGLAALGVGS